MSITESQHAPTPDYGPQAYVNPTIRSCCACGDLCLTLDDVERCDPCQAEHEDELLIAKRLLREHRAELVAAAFRRPSPELTLSLTRSGGMNDPRGITCDECGDVACWYTGSVDPLDGVQETCESCSTKGRISVDQDDEGHVRARFVGGT